MGPCAPHSAISKPQEDLCRHGRHRDRGTASNACSSRAWSYSYSVASSAADRGGTSDVVTARWFVLKDVQGLGRKWNAAACGSSGQQQQPDQAYAHRDACDRNPRGQKSGDADPARTPSHFFLPETEMSKSHPGMGRTSALREHRTTPSSRTFRALSCAVRNAVHGAKPLKGSVLVPHRFDVGRWSRFPKKLQAGRINLDRPVTHTDAQAGPSSPIRGRPHGADERPNVVYLP